jgi:hypothetical protein
LFVIFIFFLSNFVLISLRFFILGKYMMITFHLNLAGW